MKTKWIIAIGAFLLLSVAAVAQRRGGGGFGGGGGGFGRAQVSSSDVTFPMEGEFHFNRLEYTDNTGRGFGFVSRRGQASGWWAQDYPDAENHFSFGLTRLTRVNVGEPRHAGLDGDDIFEYPWSYSTQNHYMNLSDKEIEKLREYLNRGGFLMTDDMYDVEGDNFYQIVHEIYPKQEIEPMTQEDPMMHVHFSILDEERTFIPGERHIRGGRINPNGVPAWFKVSDAKGHVVIAINANTDLGDAWEYADAPFYPAEMTTLAYHYGINYLVYAATH
ncbi:MAG: DUF4159 domain-containing protein [Acidobacteriota bacterium]